MSWTVACFCGHLYTATPPGHCPGCGEPLPDVTGAAPPASPGPATPRESVGASR